LTFESSSRIDATKRCLWGCCSYSGSDLS